MEGSLTHYPAAVDVMDKASGNYLELFLEVFEEGIPVSPILTGSSQP